MPEERKKKETSLDNLAEMTHREFLATNKRIDELRQDTKAGFTAIVDTLDLMRADMHDIKISLPPLIHGHAALERQVSEPQNRVSRLERKTGLSR